MTNVAPQLISKEDILQVIPKKIIKKIFDNYQLNLEYGFHGFSHWARVLENGLIISDMNGANKNVIIAFSFFHDSCRENEYDDDEHGLRGANLMKSVRQDLNLTDQEFDLAYEACVSHTDILHHDNKDIATCFDADRLDLMRVGIYPMPEKLNTYVAKQPGVIVVCNKKAIGLILPDWAEELWDDFYEH